jgi:hypothetical protein
MLLQRENSVDVRGERAVLLCRWPMLTTGVLPPEVISPSVGLPGVPVPSPLFCSLCCVRMLCPIFRFMLACGGVVVWLPFAVGCVCAWLLAPCWVLAHCSMRSVRCPALLLPLAVCHSQRQAALHVLHLLVIHSPNLPDSAASCMPV